MLVYIRCNSFNIDKHMDLLYLSSYNQTAYLSDYRHWSVRSPQGTSTLGDPLLRMIPNIGFEMHLLRTK